MMKNWKNLCKRGLSLLVCLVMCLSMLPGVAYAKEGDDCRRAGCNGVLVAVPETPATCTEGTIKAHLTCSICGTNYHRGRWSVMYLGPVDRISDPLGHDMTYHAATEATCTIPGNVEYWSCSRCGKNFSDQAGNTEITNPTGTTNPDNHTGEQVREHDDAGHWTEWNCCHVMVGSKEAHTFTNYVSDGNATCAQDGTKTAICDVCKAAKDTIADDGSAAKVDHTWGNDITTKQPTCTTPGEKTFTCTVEGCNATKTEKIEATGHNLYHHAYVAPTCEKDGKKEYWTCITCQNDFGDAEGKTPVDKKDMVIPQLSHDYESKWSWYWDGLHYNATLTLTCKNDNSHTKSNTDANTTPDRKPDCGKEVVITYTAKVVIDGKEYTSTATRTAQPTGEHTPAEAVRENEVAATCAKEGSYDEVVYCTVCEKEISREHKTIAKLPHTPGEAVRENVVDSTCAAEGSYDEVVYCSKCNKELSREEKTDPATGKHTFTNYVSNNDATCTADGTETAKCDECGVAVDTRTEAGSKKAHTYGPWTITVEPTTEAKGEAKHTCTVCGHEETVEIPQLPTSENPGDGTWTLSEEAAPTCTETGKNVYTSEYGTVEVVVPALGHDYAEAWTAGDDNHWHVCTRCDAIDGEDAHDYDDGVVTVEPTATAEGTRTYTCQTCGHSYDVAIPATGTVTPPTPPTPPAPTPGTGGGTGGTPAPTPTPGGDVNIDEEDVPLADITFEDVLPTDPFYEAVKYVFNRGLMEGVSDTEFAPQTTLNRAMLVTILYRLEGEPEAEPSTFKDVPAGKWFTDAVGWASANEVVEGYDDDHFGPLDPLTREQMAAILHRYAKYKGYDVTDAADLTAYTDADAIHEYALDAATWSVAISVLEALTETTLGPRDNATRAQVAVALMNFCEKYVPLETEGEAA